ncbi:EpsG family protein [Pseudomonas cavernicola]|uniref:EpsG family protein n=1 Tax=Pseudomonas cavernicola TaxID=2320866 RepID=UPI001314D37F|nr:EpsG family protein [Pseudomonas cavernicola]
MAIFLSLLYFVLVAGLRDDTGYDWYVYHAIYDGVSTSSDLSDAVSFGYEKGSELGFSVFLYFLSFSGAGFWLPQILVCLLNLYAFVRLNNYLGNGAVKGLLVYYCWLFLVLQMGVMRMSISLSILSLGLIYLLQRNNVKFLVCVCLACVFHVFSLIIGFVMFLAKLNFPRRIMVPVLLVLSVLYLSGIDTLGVVLYQLSGYMPGFVFSKVDLYLRLGDMYQRGVGEFLYKFLIVVVFIFLHSRLDWLSRIERYLLNLSFIYLIFLLLFWKYPIFHDRVKYFVIMPYFYLFFIILNKLNLINRLFYGSAVLLMSVMILIHEVTRPGFYPYTPYFNMYERWLGGGGNDGEERTLKYYREYELEMGLGE